MEQGQGQGRFGIYTGIVHDRNDPERTGRLRVIVPSIMGSDPLAPWAMMIGQHAGSFPVGIGGRRRRGRGSFVVPDVGAQVAVMFLDGNVERPVWLPGIWPTDQVPPAARAGTYPTTAVLARGAKVEVVEDERGKITVSTDRETLDVDVDTRGGDLIIRTDGVGGGVIKMQAGTTEQRAIRASDTIVCGTLSVQLQPVTGLVIGITYTPPPTSGLPPVVMSQASGVTSAPVAGVHQGGSPLVLIGGGL